MRWDKEIIHRAQKLRGRGRTYSEINSQLGIRVAKSTFNHWFKGIELPRSYHQRLKKLNQNNLSKALKVARRVNRKKLEERFIRLRNKNVSLLDLIDEGVGKIMLSMMYLCEGSKYPTTRMLRFPSSNPGTIKLFLALFRGCFEIDESKFRGVVQCRADQNVVRLKKYWSKVSMIPLNQFRVWIDKRTIGKPTKRKTYKGVFVVEYFDVDVQLELQFLSEYLTEQGPVAQLVECLSGTEKVRGSSPLGSTRNQEDKYIEVID